MGQIRNPAWVSPRLALAGGLSIVSFLEIVVLSQLMNLQDFGKLTSIMALVLLVYGVCEFRSSETLAIASRTSNLNQASVSRYLGSEQVGLVLALVIGTSFGIHNIGVSLQFALFASTLSLFMPVTTTVRNLCAISNNEGQHLVILALIRISVLLAVIFVATTNNFIAHARVLSALVTTNLSALFGLLVLSHLTARQSVQRTSGHIKPGSSLVKLGLSNWMSSALSAIYRQSDMVILAFADRNQEVAVLRLWYLAMVPIAFFAEYSVLTGAVAGQSIGYKIHKEMRWWGVLAALTIGCCLIIMNPVMKESLLLGFLALTLFSVASSGSLQRIRLFELGQEKLVLQTNLMASAGYWVAVVFLLQINFSVYQLVILRLLYSLFHRVVFSRMITRKSCQIRTI